MPATWVIYATCVLRRRGLQHKCIASAICNHFSIDHDLANVPADYLDNFTRSLSRTDELRITAAILIREMSHRINANIKKFITP